MSVKFVLYNKAGIVRRICKGPKVGLFMANTVKREMDPYVPFLHGPLSQTAIVEPFKVTYIQTYAHHQWQGISKSGGPIQHSKEKHPQAVSKWNEKAEREKRDKIAHEMTLYLRSI